MPCPFVDPSNSDRALVSTYGTPPPESDSGGETEKFDIHVSSLVSDIRVMFNEAQLWFHVEIANKLSNLDFRHGFLARGHGTHPCQVRAHPDRQPLHSGEPRREARDQVRVKRALLKVA